MSQEEAPSPVVLIAGAGLGGLTAAIMCEKANIKYLVLERSVIVKPLDELKNISLPCRSLDTYIDKLELLGGLDLTTYSDMSIQQNAEGVMIRCSDNTHYHGDILIGADGAYSAVRQSLYKQLDQRGLLPAEDKRDTPLAYLCMVGTTRPVDSEKYTVLKKAHCDFATVLGKDKPHSWTTVTVPGNRISWMVWIQIEAGDVKDTRLNNSEWGPEANKSMIDEICEFPITHGGVLGDLIDATDSDLISKVYIDEKLYQTWNYGRTALIGDGAVGAMQDAVILMNCIYDIEDVTHENIKAALADYKAQRLEHALFQVDLGKTFAKIMFGQTWSERLMRTIVYNLLKWAQHKNHRPLITFLPPVPNNTNLKLLSQRPSKRYAREQAAKTTNEVTSV